MDSFTFIGHETFYCSFCIKEDICGLVEFVKNPKACIQSMFNACMYSFDFVRSSLQTKSMKLTAPCNKMISQYIG